MATPTREEIEAILDRCVRPILAADGGDIRLEAVHADGTVVLCFVKRCAGCPARDLTMEAVVEPCLKGAFPTLRQIRLVPWHLPAEEPSSLDA